MTISSSTISNSTTNTTILSNTSITTSSNVTTRIVPISSKPSFLDEVLGINNITISNIVHHKVNWHKVLNSVPILQTKYYVGIIITVVSCLLFILVLAIIEKDHTAAREFDYITSIDHDTNDMVLSEETDTTDNDTTGPRNTNDNINGSFIKEQDDHAAPPKMRQQQSSSSSKNKKSYRKLLPSQKFIIILQVTSLTVFNYLLLVLLPIDGGILPFLAMSILWIMTLRTTIRIELIKKRRLDRIVTLITLFFLLAAGLSLVTYTHHATKEGEVYSGPARIVGYDSRSYNNTDGETIRANLKVTWGGSWGCPHTLDNNSNPLFCTADVSGALCETRYKENKTKTALYQQKINNQPNETYVDYGNGTEVETTTYKNGTTTSEDIYYDVYWEAVETISPYGVLYKDKDEEVDIEYDENGEEGISVVYNNGEQVDVIKEDGSSTVNVMYGKNNSIDDYQEEDFTKNGTVLHPKTDDSGTTSNGGGNKNRVRRSLSTTTTTGGKTMNATTNNTESAIIQKEVNATVAKEKANVTKEEDNFNNELMDEAEDTVIEDVNDYSTVITNDEDTISKLQKENQNLQAANDKLKQEIAAEKQSINVTEQQDENLISSEIKLENEIVTEKQKSSDQRVKQGKAPQTYGSVNHYTYDDDIDIFTDDYWNYQWDNIWGEYACEDLFSQNSNEYGSYNPNEAPGTNVSDKWPTIEIYGNCHTCSAYLIDYYTTENFHKAEQFQKACQFYFMATAISAFFAAFFFLQYTFRRNAVKVNNPDRQKELLSMSIHNNNNNTNFNQRAGSVLA